MSGGFFRGTSAEQDTRFSNKQAKLLKSQKFAPELEHLVDMTKVKIDVIRPWIANRVTELLGFEDEVLINFIYGLLEGKEVNGKEVQISLTGFMEKNTGKFMKELWALLLSAQKNASGVPQQFLDAKEEETRKKKAEAERIANEIQKKKDKETREREEDRLRKMDDGVETKAIDTELESSSKKMLPKASNADPENKRNAEQRNGIRRKRFSRSPHSVDHSPSSPRGPRSQSASSHSNSRSYSEMCRSPRRRSFTPWSRHSPRISQSPPKRRFSYSRRRSRSRSPRRSLSPVRRRLPSPYRHRSPSPLHGRSPSPIRCRRSPSPVRRRKSPLPVLRHRSPPSPVLRHRRSPPSPVRRHRSPALPVRRRRTPSPMHRRSPSPMRHRSPSPLHRRSPARKRSPTPVRRQYRRSPRTPHHKSVSPVQHKSPASGPRKSLSPSLSRSPLPYESSSPSSARPRSPSPVRRISPKERRRSPAQAPRERYSKRSSQLDLKDQKELCNKGPALSLSPEKSLPSISKSPSNARKAYARYGSLHESPVMRRKEQVARDGSWSLQEKPRELKARHDSPGTSKESEEANITREGVYDKSRSSKKSMQSPTVSKLKSLSSEVHSSQKLADGRSNEDHVDDIELRKRDIENRSDKSSGRGAKEGTPDRWRAPMVYKDSLQGERQNESEPGEGQRFVEKSQSRHKSDSISEESDQVRMKYKEKRKHKQLERQEVTSDDDYSYDSEIEDRKEAKRRKKEERRLRKEEKRRRREERRRRREERRAEKLRRKDQDYSSSSDGENGLKRGSHLSDDEVTQSEQKKLEIELRKKALESLKAKKGINH